MHSISEKAIRFRHPDYNPDRAKKLISLSMSRHLSTRNISPKSIHAFLSNLANRHLTYEHGQKHLPPPLSEVNKITKITCRSIGGAISRSTCILTARHLQYRFLMRYHTEDNGVFDSHADVMCHSYRIYCFYTHAIARWTLVHTP